MKSKFEVFKSALIGLFEENCSEVTGGKLINWGGYIKRMTWKLEVSTETVLKSIQRSR
jgi:hypothetical protein